MHPMRILSIILPITFVILAWRMQDSPHGMDFQVNCELCHSPSGWELDKEIYAFDHQATNFPLEGQHELIACRLCHPTLIFSDAEPDCFKCHSDMHQQTVGMDCARCHTPGSWIVENISAIHRQSRFPLQGPHLAAQCLDCHPSASLLRFEPVGIECIDCHLQDYQSASSPNHVLGNFSTECIACHSMTAFSWGGAGFNHALFPLTQGHEINDCGACHTESDYADISSACISCHRTDYNNTRNPNHNVIGISTDCLECHSTNPGWKPAEFRMHDALFPIYSGAHRKEKMDSEHRGENGYIYNSTACLECHPNGKED